MLNRFYISKPFPKYLLLSLALITQSEVLQAAMPGPYIGAAGGYTFLDDFSDAQNQNDGGFGGRVFLGYNFNRYFGIEANYVKFANTTYDANQFYNVTIDYSLSAVGVVGKLYLPLGEPFSLYMALGAAQAFSETEIKISSYDYQSDSSNGLVGTIGFGANFELAQHFTANLDVSAYGNKANDDLHLGIPKSGIVSLGLSYKF